MRSLVLYTRQGCGLCERALQTIERARRRLPRFELTLRDIDSDERLHDAYFDRIPVIELDGRELAEYFLDEDLLLEALGADADAGAGAGAEANTRSG